MAHPPFQTLDRLIIQMIIMIMCNHKIINIFRHILRRITVCSPKRFVEKLERSSGTEYRIKKEGDSMQREQVGGVSEPDIEIPL